MVGDISCGRPAATLASCWQEEGVDACDCDNVGDGDCDDDAGAKAVVRVGEIVTVEVGFIEAVAEATAEATAEGTVLDSDTALCNELDEND